MVPLRARSTSGESALPFVATALAPLAYTVYLVPFGVVRLGDNSTVATLVALGLLYLVPLAALGAGLVLAVDRRLAVTTVVAVGGLVLLPFGMPPVLDSLPLVGIPVSMLAVGSGVLGAGESALRNPQQTVARFSRPALLGAGVVGVGHAALVLWVVARQYETVVDALGLWLGWGAVGMVALGAVPTLLFLRDSLVTPTLLVAALTGNTVRADLFAAPVDSLTPFYLVVWFVVLPVIVALGAVEYAVRRRVGPFPPRPLLGGDD